MKPVVYALFRLVRPLNLLIVAATLFVIRHFVLLPSFAPQTTSFDFFLLVLSAMLITGAGYVINDYYDRDLDPLNKPEKTYIPRPVSPVLALRYYWALIIAGFLPSLYLANHFGLWYLLLTYPITAASLWFYSFWAKKRPFVGNLVVAAFCAAVVYLPASIEWKNLPTSASANITWLILNTYAAFAFFSTLAREIIKDIEDIEGDRAIGCQTLPIALGVPFALGAVALCLAILGLGLIWTAHQFVLAGAAFNQKATALYAGSGLVAFFLLALFFFPKKEKAFFGQMSAALKIFMALGLGWLAL